MLHVEAERAEPGTKAVDALGELAEGVLPGVVDVGDPRRPARGEVALDQIVCGVVVAGNLDAGWADRMIGAAAGRHGRLLLFGFLSIVRSRAPSVKTTVI